MRVTQCPLGLHQQHLEGLAMFREGFLEEVLLLIRWGQESR